MALRQGRWSGIFVIDLPFLMSSLRHVRLGITGWASGSSFYFMEHYLLLCAIAKELRSALNSDCKNTNSMNHIRLRTPQSALCPLSAFLLTACFYLPGLANGQISGGISTTPKARVAVETSGCDLQFKPFDLVADGEQNSIALHSSGLALEFHRQPMGDGIWYRVGKQNPQNKYYIVWGHDQRDSGAHGYWPTVALSKDGYVIEVHSDRNHRSGSQQYYRIGRIDPNGDENQSISWKTEFINWDGGFHTSIAINDNGLIVGVHESNSSTGLYYRVGQLRNPAGGDYTIAWSSGYTGVKYDDGINPHIAINNHNQVVEVHQVTNESLLHYRRGTISEGKITFAASQRYDVGAVQPAVALLDSGLILEVHCKDGFYVQGLYSRTGKLDPSNSTLIDWSPPVKNGGSDRIQYPALAATGRYAYQTHGNPLGTGPKIYYSGAEIYCPDL
jgi:hypothetical protein